MCLYNTSIRLLVILPHTLGDAALHMERFRTLNESSRIRYIESKAYNSSCQFPCSNRCG